MTTPVLMKDIKPGDLLHIYFRIGYGVVPQQGYRASVERYRSNKTFMTQIAFRVETNNYPAHFLTGWLGPLTVAMDQKFRVRYNLNLMDVKHAFEVPYQFIYKSFKLEPYPGHVITTTGTPAYGVDWEGAQWSRTFVQI